MKRSKPLTLRTKVTLVILAVTTVAVLLGFAAVAYRDFVNFEQQMLDQTLNRARTVGSYVATDIAFADKKAAAESLSNLNIFDDVINAHLFDNEGNHFVSLTEAPITSLVILNKNGWHEFEENALVVSEPIRYDNQNYGFIQLVNSTEAIKEEFRDHFLAMLLTLLILMVFSIIFANMLQRVVSRPIQSLADVADEVSEKLNLSLRIGKSDDSEVGTLYNAFNNMLERIQDREEQRDRAEQLLHESEAKWRSITQYSPDHIIMIDPSARILFVNRALPGCQLNDMVGDYLYNYFPPTFHSLMTDCHLRVLTTGQAEGYEVEYQNSGTVTFFEVSVGSVRSSEDIVALTVSARDITIRRLAEKELARFRKAIDSSDDNIFLIDPQAMRFIDFNQAAIDDLGFTRDKLLTMGPHDIKPENDRDRLQGIFYNVINSQEGTGEITTLHVKQDDSTFPVEVRFSAWRPDDGQPVIIATARDISERKKVDVALRVLATSSLAQVSLEYLGAWLQSLIGFYNVTSGYISLLNKNRMEAETIAYCGREQCFRNFKYEIAESPCKVVLANKEKLLCNELDKDFENLFTGDQLMRSYYGAPLIDAEDNVFGFVALFHAEPMDISPSVAPILDLYASRISSELQRKFATDELVKHHNELEHRVEERTRELTRINKEMEAFSYSVSHDLRAPLRSINGFAYALLEDYVNVVDDDGRDYLHRICDNAQRMGQLIDDLLSLSRVTRQELKREHIDLSTMSANVADALKRDHPERIVNVEIEPNMLAYGDRGLMGIVLQNLIENAWKYTQKKSSATIRFGTTRVNGETVYYVRDNGAGFDMQHCGKLFGAFQRLHRRDDYEGTGIGLATVQRIIHRHGGRIWAEANVEKGATFYFNLGE